MIPILMRVLRRGQSRKEEVYSSIILFEGEWNTILLLFCGRVSCE